MRSLFVVALAGLTLGSLAQAQVLPPNLRGGPKLPPAQLEAKKTAAIQKGVKWLLEHQNADGSWNYPNEPVIHEHYPMSQGVTALTALTLLKCGTDPKEDSIARAFDFMEKAEMTWTYAVACVLLACEARATWEPPPPPGTTDQEGTRVRSNKKKAKPSPQDLSLARKALAFLLEHQAPKGLWRYPGPGGEEDLSNTQYVMLALGAAERLGLSVPREVYEKAAARVVEVQEQDGPDMEPFPFPGADMPYKELKKIADEFEKELRKLDKRFEGKPDDAKDDKGQTKADAMQTMTRAASQKVLEGTRTRKGPPGSESRGLKARGWCYIPADQPRMNAKDAWVSGSMTTSGLVALLACKAALEGTGRYERELKPLINRSLLDGAAWLTLNYAIDKNPGHDLHHFYFLYGLERVGVLGLLDKFGPHDWYQEGAQLLVARQAGDGQWLALQGTAGAVPDTCFALLFLARGTTPVVHLPTRVRTGD